MKAVHACVVVAVAVMLYGGIGHSAPAPEARDGELRSEASAGIDAFVAERMAVRGIPGVAIAVVRDGETVHLAGYGRADATGRAVTPDTPFLFGSVSKVFTAAALLQLIEEARCRWTSRSCPTWPRSPVSPRPGTRASPSSTC